MAGNARSVWMTDVAILMCQRTIAAARVAAARTYVEVFEADWAGRGVEDFARLQPLLVPLQLLQLRLAVVVRSLLLAPLPLCQEHKAKEGAQQAEGHQPIRPAGLALGKRPAQFDDGVFDRGIVAAVYFHAGGENVEAVSIH